MNWIERIVLMCLQGASVCKWILRSETCMRLNTVMFCWKITYKVNNLSPRFVPGFVTHALTSYSIGSLSPHVVNILRVFKMHSQNPTWLHYHPEIITLSTYCEYLKHTPKTQLGGITTYILEVRPSPYFDDYSTRSYQVDKGKASPAKEHLPSFMFIIGI